MDERFAQLNKMFPNSDYVQIKKYDTALWEGREYDSNYDSKAPMTKWRDCPLTYEEACKIAEKGWRIGWVVPAGYVVVDVDNEDHPRSAEMIKQILDDNGVLYCYNKSSRGTHFLFRNDAMNVPSDAVTKCSLGITVDHRANHKGTSFCRSMTRTENGATGYRSPTIFRSICDRLSRRSSRSSRALSVWAKAMAETMSSSNGARLCFVAMCWRMTRSLCR